MAMNSNDIEAIVKQVIANMKDAPVSAAAPAPKAASGKIPETARVAMLTKLGHFDVNEYKLPEIGDDDILCALFS